MGNLIYLVTEAEGRGTIGMKIAFESKFFDLAEGIEAFFALLRMPAETRDNYRS